MAELVREKQTQRPHEPNVVGARGDIGVDPLRLNPQQATYVDFARHGWYRNANETLADLMDIKPGQNVLDLCCGSGASTELILERVGRQDG